MPMRFITRRSALHLSAASVLTASSLATPRAATAATGSTAALTDPAQVHRVFRRMRHAEHEQVFFWWLQGVRSGLVDNRLLPFFKMEVGSFHRCKNLGDGRYSVTSLGLVYFTDLNTGNLLEHWANPVTQANVDFQYVAPKPSTTVFGPDGIESEPKFPAAGAERSREMSAVQIVGEDVWLTEASKLEVPSTTGGLPFRVNDMYTLQSPLRALRNPAQKFVPCYAAFNDFNSWSARFQMGDRPGTSLSRCSGRKEAKLEALPASYLALARRVHPQLLANPDAALG